MGQNLRGNRTRYRTQQRKHQETDESCKGKDKTDMETTDMKELENIQIPKGLEDRLSMKIDEWERNEKRRSA